MSFRTWMYVFAIIGLTGSAALGQANNQTNKAEGNASDHEHPAHQPPIPLPVEIITSEAASKAAESHREESRQREIDDLLAQQGMNTATQEINAATQTMKNYTRYSTAIVGVGTLLLVWTLILTGRANNAAHKAVAATEDIGKIQNRASVSIMRVDRNTGDDTFIFNIENTGVTPALNYSCVAVFYPKFITISDGTDDQTSEKLTDRVGFLDPKCSLIFKARTTPDTTHIFFRLFYDDIYKSKYAKAFVFQIVWEDGQISDLMQIEAATQEAKPKG